MTGYTTDQVTALADLLNYAKGNNAPFAVLTGAGCSISGGIPSASGLLKEINASPLGKTVRAKIKIDDLANASYGEVMSKLNASDRKSFIGKYIDDSKVNWGHLALALLMKNGYVGRVLTFNFDPLLSKACAMVGHYPAIYDFSIVPDSKGNFGYIAPSSVIHLHGQGTSLTMMNSEAETREHATKLKPLFRDTMERFDLLVIGYSGMADGALDHLCKAYGGARRLYWLTWADAGLPSHLRGLIESGNDQAEHWGGADFDKVMIELAQALQIFPPPLFSNPAEHLREAIGLVAPPPADLAGAAGLLERLNGKLEGWSRIEPTRAERREELMLQGAWQKAIDVGAPAPDDAKDISNLAWAHVMVAQDLVSAKRYDEAFASYSRAITVKPDMHEALYNWGTDLGNLASQNKDEGLFRQAFEKHAAALDIKPDHHGALNNWGVALGDLARLKESEDLFQQAFEKLATALDIKPDKHEALYNWGNYLGEMARLKESEDLFQQAFEKYAAALDIKSDDHNALQCWCADLRMLLLKVGVTDSTSEAAARLLRAQEAFGEPSYELGCLLALLGNEAGCRGQLEACRATGTLPDAAHLMLDSDLEAYRDRDWFKALVAEAG